MPQMVERSQHGTQAVFARQLSLFEPFEANRKEVGKPNRGGCGRCAYTPMARNSRARKKSPGRVPRA